MSNNPPPPRLPRRRLKKRPNAGREKRRLGLVKTEQTILRIRQQQQQQQKKQQQNNKQEERKNYLLRSRELGEDYWMDDKDIRQINVQKRALQQLSIKQLSREGRISKQKLMEETLAPYRQNWIGYFSMIIVMLMTLVTQIPEIRDPPMIANIPQSL